MTIIMFENPQFLKAIIISTLVLLASITAALSSDSKEYVAAHNEARKRKGVPPLQWDEKLEKVAKAWAEQRINDCNPRNHSTGPYGENILWQKYDEYTPARVTQVWTDEEKYYDGNKFDCKCKPETPKCMCGHYTQVMWSNTRRIGCGNVTCNQELGFLVVCNYDPPGNLDNQNPFQKCSNSAAPPPPPPPPQVATPPPRQTPRNSGTNTSTMPLKRRPAATMPNRSTTPPPPPPPKVATPPPPSRRTPRNSGTNTSTMRLKRRPAATMPNRSTTPPPPQPPKVATPPPPRRQTPRNYGTNNSTMRLKRRPAATMPNRSTTPPPPHSPKRGASVKSGATSPTSSSKRIFSSPKSNRSTNSSHRSRERRNHFHKNSRHHKHRHQKRRGGPSKLSSAPPTKY